MKLWAAGLLFFALAAAPAALQSPEQYFGFRIGSDKKLVRWDKIVEYLQAVANEIGPRARSATSAPPRNGNPFIMLEISSAENLRTSTASRHSNASSTSRAARLPTPSATKSSAPAKPSSSSRTTSTPPRSARRRWCWNWCTILPPSDSPAVNKILDNVILLLVPSLNPDGQIMVTDWYNKTLGTPSRSQPAAVSLSPLHRPR